MKRTLAKLCTVSLLSLVIASSAMASGEDKHLTLQDAVAKGMIRNPEYGVVANNELATNEELNQAKALWKPSIDAVGESGWERTDIPNFGIANRDLWHNRAAVSLDQLLFDGFGTQSENERQKYRTQSAANRVGEVAEFVSLDIVQAYLEVLRQRDLLAIARANVDDHLRILDTIQTGANAGTVTAGDVAQAKARLSRARATVTATEEALRHGESLFIQKVGEMPADMEFPNIPRDKLDPTVDDAVRMAEVNSPTLAVFDADLKVAHAEFEGSGSTMYPKLEIQAQASEGHDINGIKGRNDVDTALGVLHWNLYRGGGDEAREREYMYREAQAKERRAQAARQVEKDVRDTWAGMISASENAKEYLDQANANEKVVGVYLDQFALDRRTLLDVLDSQNELFVSRSNHVNALYTEMFAIFRVLALEGGLLQTLGVPRPRESDGNGNVYVHANKDR
jgi:adhesin transport system outer membrane protein